VLSRSHYQVSGRPVFHTVNTSASGVPASHGKKGWTGCRERSPRRTSPAVEMKGRFRVPGHMEQRFARPWQSHHAADVIVNGHAGCFACGRFDFRERPSAERDALDFAGWRFHTGRGRRCTKRKGMIETRNGCGAARHPPQKPRAAESFPNATPPAPAGHSRGVRRHDGPAIQ